MVAANELIVADKKHLDPRLISALVQGDNVHILDRIGVDLYALLIGYAFHGAYSISQDCGTLELQFLRSQAHVVAQVFGNRFGIPFHE